VVTEQKRGPGQPRKAEPAQSTSVRLRPSTKVAMQAHPDSPDTLMRRALGLPLD
jgi:hypothetical protein